MKQEGVLVFDLVKRSWQQVLCFSRAGLTYLPLVLFRQESVCRNGANMKVPLARQALTEYPISSGSAVPEVALRVADVAGERVIILALACFRRVLRPPLDRAPVPPENSEPRRTRWSAGTE
jgi:hypothetical protein